MNKQGDLKELFLSQLRKKLAKLPPEDLAEAMEYYEEYLEEAGPGHEEETIRSWGTPNRVASQILAEYAINHTTGGSTAKSGFATVWLVLLAIFASPIAVPIAVLIACVMLLLVISVLALVASLGVTAISVAAAGIFSFLTGICLIPQGFQSAVFYVGAGLFLAGAGAALCILIFWLSRKGFNGIARWFGKILPRRKTI